MDNRNSMNGMDSHERKRNMARTVQAGHKTTRDRMDYREVYPVPEIGDIIIFNENIPHHDRREALPVHGIGTVVKFTNMVVCIEQMRPNNQFWMRSIPIHEFRLGLYQYVQLSCLPKECPIYIDMDIKKLGKELEQLVIFRGEGLGKVPVG